MATLTIRNVTVTPIELKLIEHLSGSSKHGAGAGPGWFARLSRILLGLFHGSHAADPHYAKLDQEPHESHDVHDVVAGPFETRATDVHAPAHNTLRLTFQTPGTSYKYVVDCPGPSVRSQVMKKLDGAPLDLTAVYTASGAQLTILSTTALASWMRELRDEYPLSMLSVPGTHNSPTYHVALPSVRCQAVSVREQLDNGVRFLDIRVSVNGNKDDDDLPLVHSAFPVALTGTKYLADLLTRDLYAFLDQNPSEALLVSIKREGTGRGTDQQLSQHLFRRYCGGGGADGDHGDARRWFTEPRIPTLGETRGKIVLIRRFGLDDGLRGEHGGAGWGIDASAWPDNCADAPTGSGLIRVQDFYEIGESTNIKKKVEMCESHIEKACQQTFAEFAASGPAPGAAPLPFFVNFLSASNFFNASCWPEKIAAKVNPSIIEYLCTRHAEKERGPAQLDVGDAGTGVVVTDWVGQEGDWDLIRCIVAWNARLQLRK